MARGKVRARITELMAPVIAKAQMSRTEWLQIITKCCRFDPRKTFDAHGKPKPITKLEENEAAAIAGFELQGVSESRKAVTFTMKIKFTDRLTALALMGKACHWYAERQEETGRDGGPIQKNIVVNFVEPSMSPEGAYRRVVGRS
jgi:terminase small subunit-like protein